MKLGGTSSCCWPRWTSRERLDRLLFSPVNVIEVMRLTHKIEQETKGRIDEQKRRFLLREQLKTIQQEQAEDESVAVEELWRCAGGGENAGVPQNPKPSLFKNSPSISFMPQYSLVILPSTLNYYAIPFPSIPSIPFHFHSIHSILPSFLPSVPFPSFHSSPFPFFHSLSILLYYLMI